MDRANVAEWLLRQVTDPVRASELVGDQLEAYPTAGRLRFWLSIAKLLLAFSWRTIVSVAISPVGGIIFTIASFFLLQSRFAGTPGLLPETTILHIQMYCLGISMLLWAVAVFSFVHFGWRNTLTGCGLIASILWSASFCFFRNPTVAVVLAMLWAGFLIFYVSSVKRRRCLGILFAAVITAWLTGFALSIWPHDPYSVFGLWQGLAALFLVPVVQSSTTVLLYRKFIAH